MGLQERTVESIIVGRRHRLELGDLTPLVESIKSVDLLQPITVTADGVLICGRRRLEAIKQLGRRTVRVWVRGDISEGLGTLVAELDENATHKPLTAIERAALYAEVREAIRDDAARRQKATRFGSGESPTPAFGSRHARESRVQAARFVSGRDSHQQLDRILALERYASDPGHPAMVRENAHAELNAIRNGGAVDPSWQRFRAGLKFHETLLPLAAGQLVEDPSPQAHAALQAARVDRRRRIGENRAKRASAAANAKRSMRSFVLNWAELSGWSKRYDVAQAARELKPEDWTLFLDVVQECREFIEAVEREREALREAD